MKNDIIGKCPICDDDLKVSELSCGGCKTKISGEFELPNFCKLNKQQLYFAEVFIKNRGNIKEIEKELKVSYPTVRKFLDDVISSLGYSEKIEKSKLVHTEILDKLSNGEITSEQAIALLNEG